MATPPPASPADSSSTSPSKPLPRWVTWGGGVLVALLVVFIVGLLVGRGPIAGLTDRAERAEARTAQLEAQLHAQQALSLVYRATLDLDARNFGTANDRLDSAADALARTDAAALQANPAELDALRQEMNAADIRVAEDLAAQRAALSDFARRLVAMMGG